MVVAPPKFIVDIDGASHQMWLPIPSYLDAQIGHLLNVTLRRRGTSEQWPCVLCRIKSEDGNTPAKLSFFSGWRDFYDENRISHGCKVAFVYMGSNKFVFHVFGRRGFARPIPPYLRGSEEMIRAQLRTPMGRAVRWRGSGPHADRAVEHLAYTEYDYFITDTKASFEEMKYLAITNTFAKKSLPYDCVDTMRCVIQDASGEEWPMVIKFNKRAGKNGSPVLINMLRSGFKEFTARHKLPKNTTLTFEKLSDEDLVFFRANAFTKDA